MNTKTYQQISIMNKSYILLLLYDFVLLKIVKCKLFLKYVVNFQHTGSIVFLFIKYLSLHASLCAICDVLITMNRINITTIYPTL